MDKKIVRAMFSNIASKDASHPQLMGVHFEEERCVATDTRMLVVYKAGSIKLAGKILNASGEEISGRYPDVDRVIPQKASQKHYAPRIDMEQLQKACAWFVRTEGAHENDVVIIEGKALNIKYLHAILSVLLIAGDIKKAELMKTDVDRPAVINSSKICALLMPMSRADEDKIDAPREDGCPVALTYENFINQYVFESWKPKTVADPMAWLQ